MNLETFLSFTLFLLKSNASFKKLNLVTAVEIYVHSAKKNENTKDNLIFFKPPVFFKNIIQKYFVSNRFLIDLNTHTQNFSSFVQEIFEPSEHAFWYFKMNLIWEAQKFKCMLFFNWMTDWHQVLFTGRKLSLKLMYWMDFRYYCWINMSLNLTLEKTKILNLSTILVKN